MTAQARPADHEGRISRTEAAIDGLAENQRALEATVEKGFRNVFDAIDRLGERATTQRAGAFGALSTVAGIAVTVILAIGAAIGSGYVRDLSRLESHQLRIESTLGGEVDRLAAEVNGREFDRGKNDQRIHDLTAATEKLDNRLQMEMRLLNDTTEAKLMALDGRLQGEIKNAFDRSEEDRMRLRERVMVMDEELKDSRETSARLQERVGIGRGHEK